MKKTTSKKSLTVTNNPVVNKPFWPIVAILLLVIFLLALRKFGVAATVNGRPISRFHYWQRLESLDNQRTLQQMTNELLITQEAAKQKIRVEQSEIDAQIATFETELTKQGFTLEKALEAQSMTRADLENQIRLQKLLEKMSPAPAEVTDEAVKKYITENKEYLPTDLKAADLDSYAKEQLTAEAKNSSIEAWFTELRDKAKIEIAK